MRPPLSKQEQVYRQFRGMILKGEYGPGMRLPSRVEMKKQFGVALITVQNALTRLRDDGFVECRGRSGTVVVDRPPHLHRYGLVFLSSQPWSSFWSGIQKGAAQVAEEQGVEIVKYIHDNFDPKSSRYQQLLADARARRLAGVIFATSDSLSKDIREALKHTPQVCLADGMAGMPIVTTDGLAIHARVAAFLQKLRCSQIALFCAGHEYKHGLQERDHFRSRGIDVPDHWLFCLKADIAETASNIAQLLARHKRDCPKAIYIADDNLVPAVVDGLSRASVAVGREVKVLAEWNFPNPSAFTVPVTRVGFDCVELVRQAMRVLRNIASGQPADGTVRIPPVFEHEIAATKSSVAATAP